MSQSFYNYCARDEKLAAGALAKLLAAEPALAGEKNLKEVFAYARDIQSMVFAPPVAGAVIHPAVLGKFIDLGLVDSFLTNPRQADNQEALVNQLLLIYLAAGGPLSEAVLTPEEFSRAASGEDQSIRTVLLVRTLGKLLTNELDFSAYEEGVWLLLPVNSADLMGEEIDWAGALVIFLAVVLLWKNFIFLEERVQAWFLSRYTYAAAAGEVEVAMILQEYLQAVPSQAEQQEIVDLIGGALLASEEKIPADTGLRSWEKLSGVINGYVTVFSGGKPDGYKQEEFLRTLYKKEKNGEIYRSWLRPILQVVFFLDEWQTKNPA